MVLMRAPVILRGHQDRLLAVHCECAVELGIGDAGSSLLFTSVFSGSQHKDVSVTEVFVVVAADRAGVVHDHFIIT